MRGAAHSARDPWWMYVLRARRVVYVLAALAGIAAALKWTALFTLEIDLEDEDDELDTVDCTVFAAPAVAPGEALLIQVFAHLPLQGDDVRALATEFDTAATRRTVRGLQTRVARGTTLTFRLDLPGARVDEHDQSILWQGRATAVQFSAIVDPEAGAGSLIATIAVTQSGVPIGHIKFKLDVIARSPLPDRAPAPVPVGHAASRYRSAFLSYASADRAAVIRGAQLLRSVQIECFQDILDLDPGERWERRLYEAIEDSDLFLLFWSRAAKESSWVRREALHALACKLGEDDPPEIKPIVLERESIEPWPEFAHLHFRDALTHFIADADGS